MATINSYPERYYRDYDDFIQIFLADDSMLFIEDRTRHLTVPLKRFQCWLLHSTGTPIAFAEVILFTREDYPFVLADIEVRDEYRGARVAQGLVKELEILFEEKLYTTGNFTPEGYRHLTFLEVLPEAYNGSTSRVVFRTMNFVLDWPLLIPKH